MKHLNKLNLATNFSSSRRNHVRRAEKDRSSYQRSRKQRTCEGAMLYNTGMTCAVVPYGKGSILVEPTIWIHPPVPLYYRNQDVWKACG